MKSSSNILKTTDPKRDRAWGRFFAKRGASEVITTDTTVPTPQERGFRWRIKRASEPVANNFPWKWRR